MASKPNNFSLTLVTAPDQDVARRIARSLVEARLAACANLIPKIESIYWWNAKIESAEEVLILIKSETDRMEELKKAIRDIHPYTTPEIITFALHDGCEHYLKWIHESMARD